MQRGRSFKGEIKLQKLGPVVKIKLKKFLNLPKIRQEEEQFQSLLTSFDSNDSNQSFREFSKNLDIKTFRSYSKQSLLNTSTERKNIDPQFLYGLNKISSEKLPLIISRRNSKDSNTFEELNWQEMDPPHGQVKYFKNGKYIWEDIIVIQEQEGKYKVQKYPEGPIKIVNRLAIKFKNQNESRFLQAVEKQEQRVIFEIQSKRQINLINQIDSKKVDGLPQKIRQKLYKKFLYCKKYDLINKLLDDVNQLYVFDMKKCCNVIDLSKYKPVNKQFDRDPRYLKSQQSIANSSIMQPKVIQALQLFKDNTSKLLQPIIVVEQLKLPLNEATLDQYIKEKSKELTITLKKHRFFLITDIQDQLQNLFNFFQSNFDALLKDPIYQIVKLFDLKYSDLVHDFILFQHKNLQDVIQQYRLQQGDVKLKKQPFFILKIVHRNKMKVETLNLERYSSYRQSAQIIEDNELIQIEPNYMQIREIICRPNQLIFDAVQNNCFNLSCDLLPLMLLKRDIVQYPSEQIQIQEQQILELLDEEYFKCLNIVKIFQQYQYLMQPIKNKILNRIFGIEGKEKPPLIQLKYKSIKEALEQLITAQNQIQTQVADEVHVGMFLLQTKQIKQVLIDKAQENYNQIIQKLIDLIKYNMTQIKYDYQDMYKRTSTIPSTEDQLIELKLFLDEIKVIFSKQLLAISQISIYFKLLDNQSCQYDQSLLEEQFMLIQWPFEIKESIRNNRKQIELQEKLFLQKLSNDKADFTEKFLKIQENFSQIKSYNSYTNIKKYVTEVKILQELFDQAHDMVHSFNSRELLFRLPQSQYQELVYLNQEFKPYQTLWDLAGDFELQKDGWLFGNFKQLQHQQIQLKISQFVNETIQISTYFKEIQDDNAQTVAREFRRNLDQFKQNLWVIEALAIEAFTKKPSLWRELFKECKIQHFDPKEDFSFQTLISRGILNLKDQVQAISQRAEKGWNIEKRLNEMNDKLISIDIELQPYRQTFIFKTYEEVQSLFDEQLNVLIMLKSQPHVKMVLGKANQLEYKIVLIQDTLEYGMKCQKTWMYLDPIFSNDDIKNKLVKETQDFLKVDASYRFCMEQLNQNKNLWDCIENDKIKNEFNGDVLLLDQIQKSLSRYLEQKRSYFPRFYFVSDEELIEILAQTKEPSNIQKHIYKCFEGIHELKFQGTEIIGFMSQQGESINLLNSVDVNKGMKKGNVEQWLLELQVNMKETIKRISTETIRDLHSSKAEYIRNWPSQAVLLVNYIKWTRNTESAIKEQQKLNLKIYLDILTKELHETVNLVRQEQRILQKITLEAMVVMEVHAKDIVQNLLKEKIESIQDFSWISQLRYYLEENVSVKMVNASLNYGYEYLGTFTRLVITQLTDRCYRTLLGALHMNYGGAPEGPAGTGKSETVKDLAKAVAMPCIIFNCSDGLNYIAMGKFFKGLASSGAWCCFDEFNRIDPEVLSVVAQQIFTIQKAIKAQKIKFFFETEDINLILTCSINVTMNPGYTGRSELPDNLKILFRPCAMMVPDYAMIAEIYLYSVGFEKARELSAKIVACLKLCNEQLSPQEHYDFGMRTLKAILNTAKSMFEGTEESICLSALINVNKPKFLETDVDLFLSITSDLFPGIQPLEQQLLQLDDACQELEYQFENNFLDQCHYLYHTINVRNGVMCIGKTFSGKTAVIQTLSKSQSAQIYKLNPKAVTSDQLYGKLDPDTKQWADGVAPIIIRENINKAHNVWIIFDGPVDSIWIENLNTVLDDNKKLCLTSGEILKIPKQMCMLFEVEDLSAASPATISRCGMVYFQPINWYLLVQSFKVHEGLDVDYFIRRLRFLIDHSIAWCKQYGIFPVYQSYNIMVSNYLKLLTKSLETISENYDNNIIFCLVWSIGASLDERARHNFNEFLLKLLRTNKSGFETVFPNDLDIKFPKFEKIDFFQHIYIDNQWKKWIDTIDKFEVHAEMQFHELIIPTSESLRNDYFANTGLHYLFCGPTGTGKSLCLHKVSKYQITCSGQTQGNQIQRLIESKINKRRRKGYYGSEEGHIRIFIDDLNMPYREPQGAQPAIEILRQWMDQGGWYDLDTKEFKYMCDITFVAALQPSSGGRNSVTLRYLRYFNLLYMNGFDNASISNMLHHVVDWILIKHVYSIDILNLKDILVSNTLYIYEKIQSQLLPTPTKSHYVYNLRDLFKVFQGISKINKIQNHVQLIRCWAHECLRVFSDRLIDTLDEQIFQNILRDSLFINGFNIHDFQGLLFVNFMTNTYEESPLQQIKFKLQQILDEYNTVIQQNKLTLILFNNAIHHIIRIVRIISQGHALLIGMGGTGRQSLSKLSNYIQFSESLQVIDSRYWDEQLLAVLKDVGIEQQAQTLFFDDSQFIREQMLEDVCNILSHGEIPHLFPPEERLKIQEDLPYNEFIKNCMRYTHVILCMQPVGDSFRKRLRTFPTLINCTTINWFNGWPQEALESTAVSFLPQQLVKMAVESHNKILEMTDRYIQELRRHFYVTPTQYLQMLSTFKRLYNDKIEQARISIDRYETGIEKIIQTEKDVDKIRQQLFDLQPKLEKSTLENLQLLNNLRKKQNEADQKKQLCELEEKECNIKRQEANNLKDICQTQLNNVLPLLAQATDALEKISKEDMIQLKSFQSPPPSCAVVLQGLCYAFQEDAYVKSKTKDPPTTQDFWEYSKKHLLNDKLIKRIKDMKIDAIRAIHPSKIIKLQQFALNPLFDKERVFNASMAAGNLANWIRAVLETYQAVEIIEPKKKQLAQAEINLKEAEEQVKIKKKALDEALEFLKQLSEEYEIIKKEKEQIEFQVDTIQSQLSRAEKLTNGLSEEKLRWRKKAQNFKSEQGSIEGDCILSSAIIAYLGVFPIQYREICIDYFKQRLRLHQVKFSESFTIQKQLCDPVTINNWINQKLPNDQFSIDNAIILKQSPRWPLMIDPQMQANEWIKNMEDKSLLILNATQPPSQVQLQLEHAIQIGYSVILENLGAVIDQMFEPILSQRIIRKGNKASIKFGDKFIDYSNDFKFYMTTKLNNPHYQPQVCVRVTMLNFQVTLEGLTDQMLNIVVKMDEPLKEDQRIKNIQQFFINKNKQQLTEDLILKLLYDLQGNLLENDSLIDTLSTSKLEGQDIEERLRKQELDNQVFNQIRNFYRQAAHVVANLYFVVHELSMVEPTYLWSLEFYTNLYQKSIKESAYGKAKRCQNIIDKFTLLLYVTINRSLLEKDKMIFRFMLCIRLLDIPSVQIRTCVMGPTITETNIPQPDYVWLTKKMWLGIVDLKIKFPDIFGWLCDDFNQNKPFWEQFKNNQNPQKIKIGKLNQFHINMIIRIIQPDKFILAVNEMVSIHMGKLFLESQHYSLETFYQESTPFIPLLCIVTQGADPRNDIYSLAEKFNMNENFTSISLGQGQGALAIKTIKQGMQSGKWVLLQNCHVAISFMHDLEQLFESMNKKDTHKEYRLWLTSLPTNILPHNIVFKSLKLTYELPRGIKNNMLRTYYQEDQDQFENCKKPQEWKNLFFSLSLFHSCALERRKFGSLGWNIPYNFSANDFAISKEQLKFILDTQNEIQWDALHYLISETNYGGRITDPADRLLLNVILKDFLNPNIKEGYEYEQYSIPHQMSLKGYIDFIQQLPIYDPPQLFGLHPNAEIYSAIIEANNLCSQALMLLPRSFGSSTLNSDKMVKDKSNEILDIIPQIFKIDDIQKDYPLISQNSMNTVLHQELNRYNKLIQTIQSTLQLLIKALDGHVSISDDIQELYNRIFDNLVPSTWSKVSYLSIKPLGSWIIDFQERIKFMRLWVTEGQPICFWLGAFFYIPSFITGNLQNHSRQHKIAIDRLKFDFHMLQDKPKEKPKEGFYVYGLLIDGAQYDFTTQTLEESDPSILVYEAPILYFQPVLIQREYNYYKCPLYNTPLRRGDLTISGFSTNYIKKIFIPIIQNKEFWIKRGVAMLVQGD